MLVPDRVDRMEMLDLGRGTDAEAAESLADLRRINRHLGGVRTLTRHLFPRLDALDGRTVTVLDMGTGSADLPVAIARWARKRRRHVKVVAVDLMARHLAVARRVVAGFPEISLVQADVLHAPFVLPAADYVVSSLLLHHFKPPQVVALLRLFYAHARCGLIVNDLERHWLPWVGIKLLEPIFARSWITRFDGPASVLRAYTRGEMRDHCTAAGVPARITRHWPWRLAVVADKSGGRAGPPCETER